ncbi:MAG: hypothetical protein K8F91_26950 [Candidatus Obscuribacterales bacterium]|nr:hypothetical protein [Candidatus Obscuribacterales bacterium]
MKSSKKSKIQCKHQASTEERLGKMGARIDTLIKEATDTRLLVTERLKGAKDSGTEALDEFKATMDKAWEDVNHAWVDFKDGAERAADKLH